jgi:hypothetical protein
VMDLGPQRGGTGFQFVRSRFHGHHLRTPGLC